jgi:hypothetical protein
MLGTLSRFDKLKALSKSMGLPNGLVETALRAPAFAKATAGKMEDTANHKKPGRTKTGKSIPVLLVVGD